MFFGKGSTFGKAVEALESAGWRVMSDPATGWPTAINPANGNRWPMVEVTSLNGSFPTSEERTLQENLKKAGLG